MNIINQFSSVIKIFKEKPAFLDMITITFIILVIVIT